MEPRKHLGGILYSVVSLAVIAEKTDRIYPIMNLGIDEYVNVITFLSKFSNIKTDFIYRCSHKTRLVNLHYNSEKAERDKTITYDREENSTEPTLPLYIEQIKKPLRILDGLLINMISGIDIFLDTLISVREIFPRYMHMDLHNIVMKTNKDGARTRVPVKKWLNWCTNTNSLQMNEAELQALTKEGLSEQETAEKILNSGNVRSIIITRGIKDVTLYVLKKSGKQGIERTDFPVVKAENFKDSTGCGDVFASGFFYKISRTGFSEIHSAINFANRIASRNSELTGAEELYKLIE
jgi:sugar/nucleoside kinase (ribokinase family)